MAVEIKSKELTRRQAQEWIDERGIERLPKKGELLEYVPPGSYNQYNLSCTEAGYELVSHVIVAD